MQCNKIKHFRHENVFELQPQPEGAPGMKIGSTDDTTTGKEAERKTSMPDGTTMRSDCIIAWSEFLAVSARYAERQMHEKTLKGENLT